MSVCGKFELNITTSTQEEMDKIAEAIYSGFAETVIKQHVLWSQYIAPTVPTTSPKPADPGPELKRVTTHAKSGSQPFTLVKKERTTGVIGRGRMGRTQK